MSFSQEEYYRKNKKRITQHRKNRYATDADYRKQIKDRALIHKQRNRTVSPKGVIKSRKGFFITIGKLSEVIGKDRQTIRMYHRTGILPTPTHFDTRGWRLYTVHQVLLIKKAFEQLSCGELAGLKDIFGLVEGEWEKEDVK